MRPVLQFNTRWHKGETAGIQLSNVGLGPAVIKKTELYLDGVYMGPFDERTVNQLRDKLESPDDGTAGYRPRATTLGGNPFLPVGYERYLLFVNEYCATAEERQFVHLISQRLGIAIEYESLFGDAKLRAEHNAKTS